MSPAIATNTDGLLNHIPVFLAVVRYQGFTAAGRVLGISGSAVGQTIKQFEQQLKVQLFVRSTRHVVLTAAGKALFEQLEPATEAIGEALAAAKANANIPRGQVKIVAPREAVNRLLVPVLPSFSEHYPNIHIDLTVSDKTPNIISEGYDLTLQIGEVIDQDMVALPLIDPVRQVIVATPQTIMAHGKPEHPRELADLPCIGWRWEGHDENYEWEFFENGRWFRVRVKSTLVSNDRPTGLALCLRHAGYCCVSQEIAIPYINNGQLISVLDEWCAPFSGWHLIYPRQRFVPQHIRALINAIKNEQN